MKYWFIIDNVQMGPMTLEEVKGVSGLSLDTPVWYEGLPDWTTVRRIPELAALFDVALEPEQGANSGAHQEYGPNGCNPQGDNPNGNPQGFAPNGNPQGYNPNGGYGPNGNPQGYAPNGGYGSNGNPQGYGPNGGNGQWYGAQGQPQGGYQQGGYPNGGYAPNGWNQQNAYQQGGYRYAPGQQPEGERPPMPNNYLVWAILVTICCCIVTGVVAIVYASKVSPAYYRGDYLGAQQASEKASMWVIISFVLGLIVQPFYTLFTLMSGAGDAALF